MKARFSFTIEVAGRKNQAGQTERGYSDTQEGQANSNYRTNPGRGGFA